MFTSSISVVWIQPYISAFCFFRAVYMEGRISLHQENPRRRNNYPFLAELLFCLLNLLLFWRFCCCLRRLTSTLPFPYWQVITWWFVRKQGKFHSHFETRFSSQSLSFRLLTFGRQKMTSSSFSLRNYHLTVGCGEFRQGTTLFLTFFLTLLGSGRYS